MLITKSYIADMKKPLRTNQQGLNLNADGVRAPSETHTLFALAIAICAPLTAFSPIIPAHFTKFKAFSVFLGSLTCISVRIGNAIAGLGVHQNRKTLKGAAQIGPYRALSGSLRLEPRGEGTRLLDRYLPSRKGR